MSPGYVVEYSCKYTIGLLDPKTWKLTPKSCFNDISKLIWVSCKTKMATDANLDLTPLSYMFMAAHQDVNIEKTNFHLLLTGWLCNFYQR